MKNRNILFALIGLTVLIGLGIYLNHKFHSNNQLPPELYNEFGCSRATLEVRSTDIYCDDYQLYKKDHAAGKI